MAYVSLGWLLPLDMLWCMSMVRSDRPGHGRTMLLRSTIVTPEDGRSAPVPGVAVRLEKEGVIPCHRIDMLDVIDVQCVRAATEHGWPQSSFNPGDTLSVLV